MPRGSLAERFWAKVSGRDEPTECWIWLGCKGGGKGYGQIGSEGKLLRAHRVSWELANGPIARGMFLDHSCNIRACVNPSHLRLATMEENNRNRKINRNNSCGFKGVYFEKSSRRWRARIRFDNVTHNLGRFSSPELAYEAYCRAATNLHGAFANLGEMP